MFRARISPSLLVAAAFGVGLAAASPAEGQYRNAVETQIADLEQMRDKFLALAEAFPEDTYAWRPMEGVRSVHDVMALMAAECVLFPPMWGLEGAAWAGQGFRAEMGRLSAMSKANLIEEMQRAFGYLMETVSGLTEADRARQVEFFGRTVDLGTAITLMANDMHEHLGQSIAYARSNQIVPPWSR